MAGTELPLQVTHPGAPDTDLIFIDGQRPPHFAVIRTAEEGTTTMLTSAGLFDREGLNIFYHPDPIADEDKNRLYELLGQHPYAVDLEASIIGEYPGGVVGAAHNLAKLVLGSEQTK
ncbi:MAG TPA: hypothetical protein VHT70_01450 [Candidatus Saccharimonadales bacterium]|jgi:hypothetical protein|nr:hypothetical protein [Candidatus Saccharimonadales bacterium]